MSDAKLRRNAMTSKYVWMDGEMVAYENATLHFLTAGLHYGAGVFEGIRCYATDAGGCGIFRLAEHVERFLNSAKVFGFRDFPYGAAELVSAIKATVAANGMADCYVRPLAYLKDGGWNLTLDSGEVGVAIAVWTWRDYLGKEALEKGVRANVSSFTRHHPNVMMTKAKITGNYANSILAKTESTRLGFDEAIMLDAQGYVAECTGENLFLVRAGKLFMPPAAAVLEGITRATLVTLARDLGYEVVEAPMSRDQLYVADEAFVCGTAAECVALREIDARPIGAGTTGPVTRRLQRAYHDAVRGRHPRSGQWLDPVALTAVADRVAA